jgi:hypothetical protein
VNGGVEYTLWYGEDVVMIKFSGNDKKLLKISAKTIQDMRLRKSR